MADLLFAPAAVGADVEPAAPGPAHHRRPAHRPGGRGRRRGARPRPRPPTGSSPTTASHSARRARRRVPRAGRRVLARPSRRRPHPRRRALPARRRSRSPRRSPTRPGSRGDSQLAGRPGVVCTFIGDGATSEGDFYEAINLAGVQHVPLIVVVHQQRVGDLHAHRRARPRPRRSRRRREAAGVPGVRVDGNDVLAVLEAHAPRRAAARPAVTGPRCSSSSPTGWARTPTPTTRRATSPPTSWPSGRTRDPDRAVRERAPALRVLGRRAARSRGGRGRGAARAHHRRARWRARSIPTAALDHVVAHRVHDRGRSATRSRSAAGRVGAPSRRHRPRRPTAHGGEAADPKQEVCRGEHDDARGDPRDAARRDGARRARRAPRRGRREATAACSAPPTARSSASAPRACSTRRSPSRRSSARRSGCRSPGSCRSPRSSSAASPCRRTTSSSASSPASGTAAGVAYQCPVTLRAPYGGGVRTPEHHSRLGGGAVHAHARAEASWCRRTRPTPRACSTAAVRSDDPVIVSRADPLLPHHVRRARRRAPRPLGRRP